MSQVTAADRLARLLAVIPWVAARGDEGATFDEISARFGYPPEELEADLLNVVQFVGVPPFSPDNMIEAFIDDDRVRIGMADWFSRPMRLTPQDVVALVTAGKTVLRFDPAFQGEEADGGEVPALARGLAKLMAVSGSSDSALDVTIGDVPQVRAAVEQAVAERRALEIDYYSYGRDARTTRVVEPYRLRSDRGQWYLFARCRLAEADRVFRLDRILGARVLDEQLGPVEAPGDDEPFRPHSESPRVVLEVGPGAGWVQEQYPNEGVEDAGGGRKRITLPVTGRAWLERLLVRLGPEGRVVEGPEELREGVAAEAARRILARYGARS